MNEGVKISKSNIGPNTQEIANLHIKCVYTFMHRFHFIGNLGDPYLLKAGSRMFLMVKLLRPKNFKFIRKHYRNPTTVNIQHGQYGL